MTLPEGRSSASSELAETLTSTPELGTGVVVLPEVGMIVGVVVGKEAVGVGGRIVVVGDEVGTGTGSVAVGRVEVGDGGRIVGVRVAVGVRVDVGIRVVVGGNVLVVNGVGVGVSTGSFSIVYVSMIKPARSIKLKVIVVSLASPSMAPKLLL